MDTTALQSLQLNGAGKSSLSQGDTDGPMAHLGQMFADFTNTLQTTDQAAQATMAGGADPHALVEAMAQAQLAMDTAVTLRDRAVEAYQEILRMPI